VPFGRKMRKLNGGPNFLLGMQDGPDYQRQRQFAMQVFKLEDIPNVIGPLSASLARKAVRNSGGQLDAIRDLVTLIPTELCDSYFGLSIPDKHAFAMWTIAMSAYTFAGSGKQPPGYRRAAIAGAKLTRALVKNAIQQTIPNRDTVLGRLLLLRAAGNGPSDDEIRSILMGMITGFVPTNTMAAGHMLEMLLRRPDMMLSARAAAIAGDNHLLSRCLFEAMRFKPLNPGPFRRCAQDYAVAEGTCRATTIRKGATVLVSTQSAMFDARRVDRPWLFNPERPSNDYMLFGSGLHWCVGAFLADAQITQMFKALLVQPNLRRAAGLTGQLRRIGPFPEHLVVTFGP
jgi:cytochrome P450